MFPTASARFHTLVVYGAFVALALGIVGLHTCQFQNIDYRQDEAWDVHAALVRSVSDNVVLRAQTIHPPGWYIIIDGWVNLFDHVEPMTRLLSVLFTLLTLAFTFRLAADLFDRQTGLMAVALLGTAAFFMINSHEARPYAPLALSAAGAQLAFVRWVRRPRFSAALLLVLCGMGLLYFQYAGIFVLAALVIFGLVVVRWNRALALRGALLLLLIGLSFVAWALPLLYSIVVTTQGGISYALPGFEWIIRSLYQDIQTEPVALADALLLLAVVLPVTAVLPALRQPPDSRLRWSPHWRKLYVTLVPLTVVLLSAGANEIVRHAITRNFIVIMPPLAVLIAFALRGLPWQARMIMLTAFTLAAVSTPLPLSRANLEMVRAFAPYYRPGTPMVVEETRTVEQVLVTYYLRERLGVRVPNQDMLHVTNAETIATRPFFPDPPLHMADLAAADVAAQVRDFVGAADTFWYLTRREDSATLQEIAASLTEFAPVRQLPARYSLTIFQRRPDALADLFLFGDTFALRHWELTTPYEVQACDTVRVESWWTADAPPDTNYSLTLVLADAGGMGVARQDSAPADQLTLLWQPGTDYLDTRALALPCDLPPGEYALLLGLYDPQTLADLPVSLPDGTPQGSRVYLTTLTVR